MFILSFVDYLIGTCICLCFWIYYIFEERKLPLILRLPLIIASVFFAEPWIFFAFGILYKFPSLIEALFNWIFIIICFITQWDLDSIGGYVEMGENILGDILAIPLFAGSFFVTYLLVVATCNDIEDNKTRIEVSIYEIVASYDIQICFCRHCGN